MAIATLPTTEPTSIYAGDSVTWKISNSDYPASSGWTLKYDLVKNGTAVLTLTSTASGADHLISIAASTTAGYTAGEYFWRSYVTNSSSEKYGISEGYITIKANLTTATTGYDFRSTAKKVIDALESELAGDTSATNLLIISQSCGELNVSRKADIYEELQKWKAIWDTEKSKIEIEQGRANKKSLILMRFKDL